MTLKQRKFMRELIRTFSPTEAAMRSYNCKDRKIARVIASQNLTKLNIVMDDLLVKMGLNIERDIEDLMRLREANITRPFAHEGVVVEERVYEDNATRLKALELTLKIKGLIKEKVDHSGIPSTQVNVYPTKVVVFKDIDDSDIERNRDLHVAESPARSGTQGEVQSP